MSSQNSRGISADIQLYSPNSANTSTTKDDEQLQADRLLEENLKLNSLRHAESQNNTSSGFELPSEFKVKWENLIKEQIMDTFGDYFDQINVLTALVQYSFRSVQQVIKEALNEKLSNVIKLFNLQTNDKTQGDLQVLLKPFLKNNYKEIFRDQSLIDKIRDNFLKQLKLGYFSEDQLEQIECSIEDNLSSLNQYLNHVKIIILYMEINEPQISLQELKLPERSEQLDQFHLNHFYADSFMTIDGFEKDGNPCAIILNQPKIGNGSFAGIKPAVIIYSRVPDGYNPILVDIKTHMLGDLNKIINASVPNFQIRNPLDNPFDLKPFKEMTITPRQEKKMSPTISIQSQKMGVQCMPPAFTITLKKEKIQIPEIQHIVTNEEQEESDDNDNTENEILNDLSPTRIQKECLDSHRTPINEGGKLQSLINCLSEFSSNIKLVNQSNTEKSKSAQSRNSQQNNSSFTTQNRSLENIYVNQASTTKNSGKKVPRKQKNQSLYDNLNNLQKANYQGSRFIQCSLNFSKFLRNVEQDSPNVKQKALIYQYDDESQLFKQNKHEDSILMVKQFNLSSHQELNINVQSNYDSKIADKNSQTVAKKRRETINYIPCQSHNKNPNHMMSQEFSDMSNYQGSSTQLGHNKSQQKQSNYIVMTSKNGSASATQHYYQGKSKQLQSQKDRGSNSSIQRNHKLTQSSSNTQEKRRQSPLHERIVKQGQILRRKPSVNPTSASTIVIKTTKDQDFSQTIDGRIKTKQNPTPVNGSFKGIPPTQQQQNYKNCKMQVIGPYGQQIVTSSQLHSPRNHHKMSSRKP
ncbi:UNKNOWN [Stylonychia lemnae]|uniref:Uncharacterized protein n=1 Tax=Stylonychia lemnae TaxID=5949 RepID=A0A078AW95_STYLE|nr:UNKNOWN [Stylonychia lemnae]|eukprot:CDW86409.1 UNKNOWN [Stylonychia lemnae]